MSDLMGLLYEAAIKDVGLIVASEEPLLLRTRLYALRAKDPSLKSLSLVLSPTNPAGELWIVKMKPISDDMEL